MGQVYAHSKILKCYGVGVGIYPESLLKKESKNYIGKSGTL